jgi:cytochrome c oxidase assembly protein subunit 15
MSRTSFTPPDWLTFRRFAGVTTGMTTLLVMLGVYTAATGSGLACMAQWPLCDNGLLPQTIPSFIEWFHRLWAMITGFFILGTAGWALKAASQRRVQFAFVAAVVLLPLQISIGAVTVTLNGWLPNGYSPLTQGAHLFTALSIFTALSLGTVLAYDGHLRSPPSERARSALLVAVGALVVSGLASRMVTLVAYTPTTQAVFYGATLVAYAGLLAAAVWLGRAGAARLRYATLPALGLVFTHLALGRDLVYYDQTVLLVNLGVVLLAGALTAVLALLAGRQSEHPGRSRGAVSGD